MMYFGGKVRISKSLSEFLNNELLPNQPFYDLCCGSMNIMTKIDPNRLRVANDIHQHLMSMWYGVLYEGFIPPKEWEEYKYNILKRHPDVEPVTGFVGFGCSFGGKWFGGYARDNNGRNYCLNAHNSVMKKKEKLQDVELYSCNYYDVPIEPNSMIYLDIPYKGTTKYKGTEDFDYDKLYDYVKKKSKEGHKVYVSEYKHNVPKEFDIVWEMKSKQDMHNKNKNKTVTEEVLFTYGG